MESQRGRASTNDGVERRRDGSFAVRYPLPERDGWDVTVVLVVVDGDPVAQSLTVSATTSPPPTALTARMLRSVSLEEAYRQVAPFTQRQGLKIRARRPVADFKSHPRPGRKGRSDSEYAKVAAAYVALLSDPKPVQRLAKGLDITASQATHLLNEARNRGLLTRPTHGKAGGSLTEKALGLVHQQAPGRER